MFDARPPVSDPCTSAELLAAALASPPSPEILAGLLTISPGSVGPDLEVDVMIAWERMAAWVAAKTQTVIARIGDLAEAAALDRLEPTDGVDMPLRAAHAEIAAALRLSDVSAMHRLELARTLTYRLPQVRGALEAGDISYWHAAAIADATRWLDEPKAAAVAARVLPNARHQNVANLRRSLKRAVIAADPKTAAERSRRAQADREVQWRPLEDGMAELRITAAAADIQRLFTTADDHAKTLPRITADGQFVPLAARRVDAFIALINAGRTSPPGDTDNDTTAASRKAGGRVSRKRKQPRPELTANITIDLPTLLGLTDNPVELAGYGPIPAEAGRALAADAGSWRRLICAPLTGELLDLGVNTYTPSEALARFVKTRDQHCTFPGCHRTAWRCDLDHVIPHVPGCCGPTDRSNLGPLCQAHHRLKHEAGWRKHRDPDTGEITWTSLLGKHYFVQPIDHRADPDKDHLTWPDDPPLPDSIQTKLDAENLSYCRPMFETATPEAAAAAREECPF